MNRFVRTLVAPVALLSLIAPAIAAADDDDRAIRTHLSGFHEVIAPSLPTVGAFNAGAGAVFTTGSGSLELTIDKKNREIHYKLTYAFPDAAATPTVGTQFVNQAHLHFGQKHTTGAINVWLCQSPDNPAPGAVTGRTPQCPSPSASPSNPVSGTILPEQILTLAGQGFPDGVDAFDALLEAIENHAIYANVHTDRFTGGEIRGQLNDRHGRHND